MTNLLKNQLHIHFIGVGGIGMSGLAAILNDRGYSVSGSDKQPSTTLERLSASGIKIFNKQNATNIQAICKSNCIQPLVVVSSAIPSCNQEFQAAQKAKLKICHRSDILAELIKQQPSIAVAGSHGKTTTSTFITTLLAQSNQDPTAVIGGVIPYYKSNNHVGQGKFLVAEADESDGSLVKFQAELGVITNLELDHIDHYKDLDSLIKTIKVFEKSCKNSLANFDCPTIRQNIKASNWYSTKTSEGVDFAALPIKLDGKRSIANIYEKGRLIGQISLPMPGIHNLSNAIAAIGACRIAGIPFALIENIISTLKAPGRRFDFRGIWEGRQIVDDYAHHPSEVKATLSMARLMINSRETYLPQSSRRLVVVFQPHRYSRTKQFLKEFAIALGESDLLLIAPVFSAGEVPIQGINSQALAKCFKQNYPTVPVIVSGNLDDLTKIIKNNTQNHDLVLTLGAGDINILWDKLQSDKKPKSWKASKLAA